MWWAAQPGLAIETPAQALERAHRVLELGSLEYRFLGRSQPLVIWPELWHFAPSHQQPRLAAYREAVGVEPAYYLTKALALLSIRGELSKQGTPEPLAGNGARGPLFAELASIFAAHQPLNSGSAQIALAPRFSRSFWLEGF